ncbi:MAG: TIR domain-containing protein [Pirellulaceae bacterium]|nr:TIR domain-containing protein [Pirellulaceae bacterium]
MAKLFISHSSLDDAFVRELRVALADHGQDGWIDSRELRGGDPLWPEIQKAIEAASAYAVVISAASFQSDWVSDELEHAIEIQQKRGREAFPVIPLMLDGAKLGAFKKHFGQQPLHIPVTSDAGGIEAAMNAILVALGKRRNADVPGAPQPQAEPLEELVLELSDLKFKEEDGVRRASARARLVYQPATPGQPNVHSAQSWRLIAPIGPIEAEELRWYLEKYAVWPSHYFRDRARKVEENLVRWGRLLHEAALPVAHREEVMKAWEKTGDHAGRRFSVHVDVALEAGAPETDVKAAQEAATVMLGLPWELLHDGKCYLFQGAKPTRVRRTLPGTEAMGVAVVATPIRILLVTARPEDDACGYIDHRASALPLVEAMEALPGLVKIHVLSPPTLSALRDELDRARGAREPYHVVHFDGHGVYDKRVGLGGLCFELPEDTGKLEKRRHVTVFTSELGPLLRDHRIPLVFLEACQTAQAEKASESVASELLKVGVASVVAMSHSVLVETAKRFVAAFYQALAEGKRVGDAMLAGQRELEGNKSRGRVFGADELNLHDWFVPVLFQEKDDPQLFKTTPAKQTVADFQEALATRLGNLPPVPETGFVGRSRELLALQRLLFSGVGFQPASARGDRLEAYSARYAVVRGQGGEGKTALAAEFARWMVRSHQMRRGVFVSVETHGHAAAVLDAIGSQLVPGYSVATFDDLEKAIHPIEQVLAEQSTLLVVDNMESILLPPYSGVSLRLATSASGPADGPAGSMSHALSEEADRELKAILALCERLLKVGDTRLVFTSREALPAPFDAARQRRELHRLDREDAVKLVERALNAESSRGGLQSAPSGVPSRLKSAATAEDAARESIEALVEAVHGHARTLALLAPELRSRGVEATREALVELMAAMERQFPGSREHSVFASVELSLRRMSAANWSQQPPADSVTLSPTGGEGRGEGAQVAGRVLALGVFHGGVQLGVLRMMMQWEEADVGALAVELIATGLATPNRYNHLTLNPALCPYLRGRLYDGPPRPSKTDDASQTTARWVAAMRAYVRFLVQQSKQDTEVAATLTVLELPNLFALLDLVQRTGDAEATIDLATLLYRLLQSLGKPRLLERVGQVRDAAAAALGDAWNHARFEAARTRIEQQHDDGRLREAFDGAQQLLQRARTAGEQAYPDADYDLAVACFLLARVQKTAGGSEQALPLLDESRRRFEAVEKREPGCGAAGMAAKCLGEQGVCLTDLGRLDEAAAAHEECGRRGE